MNINLFCEKAEKIFSAEDTPTAEYALDLIEHLKENADCYQDALYNKKLLRKALLNGANDWNHYSFSGCSLCYNTQIAERLRLYSVNESGIKCYKQMNGEQLLGLQSNQLKIACQWILELREKLL